MRFTKSPASKAISRIPSIKPQPKISSMVLNVLHATVQSRIPTVSSIRKIIHGARHNTSSMGSPSCSTEKQSPDTPPPGYTSRPASARSRSCSFDGEVAFRECISSCPPPSISTPPSFFPMAESSSGINWKYANQGINLVSQSYTESHALARIEDESSASLTRQLYLHGMTYLLRGLPSELTPEETVCLQAAIPSNLTVVHTEPCAHAMTSFAQESAASREAAENASTLHRVVAIIVFQTFAMIHFLLPYMKLFAGHAYRLEKQHKITQKMVNSGLMTADRLRQRSLELSHTICQMNDGKVGQALNDLVIWIVRGLTGGFQQGVTEGITMMSKERATNQRQLEQAG